MRSSFFEFTVATSALFTARGGFDTVSHNVANASTKGYTRQIVEQRATKPMTFYNGKGMIGTGSEIFGIDQVRDFYLDKKYWSEIGVLGEYSAKYTHLSLTERVFNELSGTGIKAQFNDFFARLQELTTNAGDKAYRTNLLEMGNSMTTFFKNTYEALSKQQKDLNQEIKTVVARVNSIGQQIVSLNRQISTYEMDGSKANDLRDQRARLVDELSRYVNVEVQETERNLDYAAGKYPEPEERGKSEKEFSILINGQDFVKGYDVSLLKCVERATSDAGTKVNLYQNPEDNAGLYDIYWATSGAKFDVYHPDLTGELKGLIDVRDGNNGNYVSMRMNTANTYNDATGEVTLAMGLNRVDLNPNGGVISLTDVATGRTIEYAYKSYVNNGDGTATFTLVDPNSAWTSAVNPFSNAANSVTIGKGSNYKGIPYYMSRLNDLVRTFAKAINEGKYMNGTQIKDVAGHANGYDLYGNQTGMALFTYYDRNGNEIRDVAGFDIYQLNARNIAINTELLRDPKLLGASVGADVGQSDNNIILQFIKLKNNDSLFLEGNIEDYIVGMAAELGIDVKQAQNFYKNYTDVTSSIDNQRMSVSGVDINEEMVNMIKYQQQYQAAAKLINIIDSIYDTTINGLGR